MNEFCSFLTLLKLKLIDQQRFSFNTILTLFRTSTLHFTIMTLLFFLFWNGRSKVILFSLISSSPQSVFSLCLVLPDWAALPDSGHWIQAAASGLRTPSPRVPTYFTQTRPKLSALQRFIPRVLIIIQCDHATLPLISSS